MPVLEDGLSDSEQIINKDNSPLTTRKRNSRHQATQSDFVFSSNHSSVMPSHKQQYSKAKPNEQASQSSPMHNSPSIPSSKSQIDQHRMPSQQSSISTTGRVIFKIKFTYLF